VVEQPSRLLELLYDEAVPTLRLCETSTLLTSNVPYVTLSYCWGPRQFVKLRSDNYTEFKKSIPIEILPQTFRDAIHFTHQLGQRFIWIDALCIVQDDPADWRRESELMGRIYSGGVVNISASASKDVEGGLFHPRQVLRIIPCVTRPKWRGFDNDMLVWFNIESYWRKVYSSPISKRAWCLQERLLATRTIHFTENQLYWECNTIITSEADPVPLPKGSGGLGDDLRRTVLLPHLQTSRRYTDPEWAPTKIEMLNTAWSRLVGAYTQAKLTVETDKLVAISGLARKADELHEGAGKKYLAGLWEANLPVELLWRVIDPVSASPRRLTSFAAPSWSWASVDGAIELPMTNRYRNTAVRASILGATTTPFHDPFGAVSSGSLRIRGPVWEVKIVIQKPPKPISPDDFNLEPDSSADVEINSFLMAGCQVCWDDRSSSAIAHYLANPLYVLAITEDINPNSIPIVRHIIMGILLMPTYARKGQYLRVGWVSLASHLKPDNHKALLRALRSAALSADRYEEEDGHDQYTIEIQ
jgi:hypothetical protein